MHICSLRADVRISKQKTYMQTLKFILLLLAASFFLGISVNGQEKWSVKLSYGTVRGTDKEDKNSIRDYPAVPHFRLEANHNILNNLSAGCYLGYSQLYKTVLTGTESTNALTSTNALFYGISADYRLLALLTNKVNNRFEVYPTLKLGLVSEFWKESIGDASDFNLRKFSNTTFEFGAGLGSLYKITPDLGVFGEYTLGKFYNNSNSRFHIGLFLNF